MFSFQCTFSLSFNLYVSTYLSWDRKMLHRELSRISLLYVYYDYIFLFFILIKCNKGYQRVVFKEQQQQQNIHPPCGCYYYFKMGFKWGILFIMFKFVVFLMGIVQEEIVKVLGYDSILSNRSQMGHHIDLIGVSSGFALIVV
eukprot:TRINITY_DN6634_c0_g2_i7.p4 TRINITY_DN6634_c0_g2~~TRINITY_DN6634_c0_g2_i7.p4  ORF type:complete len:143 (+),score=5.10 TRINITY_DN6634_c0_g2_i7:211-639(+)